MAKACTKCGGSGPFRRAAARKDGLAAWCNACTDRATRAWIARNATRSLLIWLVRNG